MEVTDAQWRDFWDHYEQVINRMDDWMLEVKAYV